MNMTTNIVESSTLTLNAKATPRQLFSINDTCLIFGQGRSKLYALIRAGDRGLIVREQLITPVLVPAARARSPTLRAGCWSPTCVPPSGALR